PGWTSNKNGGTCRAGASRPCSDVSVEHLLDVCFSHCADSLVDYLSALEHEQGGNGANLVAARGLNVGSHIELADFGFPGILRRDLIDGRRHHPARATPLGPEIHQNRLNRAQNFLIESSIRK